MKPTIWALGAALLLAPAAVDGRSHHSSSYYSNVSGHRVHSTVFSHHAPRGATAPCADGTYSFSEHHQGTCSHHGGVSTWL
jgi:hypothetical protein